MSVVTLEGFVENGQIRLLDQTALPEKARVYVVVPDASDRAPHIWSPRLADPAQAAAFSMQVTKHGPSGTDADV
ncbi:MAG TPA: hypothetical protein VGC93_13210 [Thermoanaerobaculia bacterium]